MGNKNSRTPKFDKDYTNYNPSIKDDDKYAKRLQEKRRKRVSDNNNDDDQDNNNNNNLRTIFPKQDYYTEQDEFEQSEFEEHYNQDVVRYISSLLGPEYTPGIHFFEATNVNTPKRDATVILPTDFPDKHLIYEELDSLNLYTSEQIIALHSSLQRVRHDLFGQCYLLHSGIPSELTTDQKVPTTTTKKTPDYNFRYKRGGQLGILVVEFKASYMQDVERRSFVKYSTTMEQAQENFKETVFVVANLHPSLVTLDAYFRDVKMRELIRNVQEKVIRVEDVAAERRINLKKEKDYSKVNPLNVPHLLYDERLIDPEPKIRPEQEVLAEICDVFDSTNGFSKYDLGKLSDDGIKQEIRKLDSTMKSNYSEKKKPSQTLMFPFYQEKNLILDTEVDTYFSDLVQCVSIFKQIQTSTYIERDSNADESRNMKLAFVQAISSSVAQVDVDELVNLAKEHKEKVDNLNREFELLEAYIKFREPYESEDLEYLDHTEDMKELKEQFHEKFWETKEEIKEFFKKEDISDQEFVMGGHRIVQCSDIQNYSFYKESKTMMTEAERQNDQDHYMEDMDRIKSLLLSHNTAPVDQFLDEVTSPTKFKIPIHDELKNFEYSASELEKELNKESHKIIDAYHNDLYDTKLPSFLKFNSDMAKKILMYNSYTVKKKQLLFFSSSNKNQLCIMAGGRYTDLSRAFISIGILPKGHTLSELYGNISYFDAPDHTIFITNWSRPRKSILSHIARAYHSILIAGLDLYERRWIVSNRASDDKYVNKSKMESFDNSDLPFRPINFDKTRNLILDKNYDITNFSNTSEVDTLYKKQFLKYEVALRALFFVEASNPQSVLLLSTKYLQMHMTSDRSNFKGMLSDKTLVPLRNLLNVYSYQMVLSKLLYIRHNHAFFPNTKNVGDSTTDEYLQLIGGTFCIPRIYGIGFSDNLRDFMDDWAIYYLSEKETTSHAGDLRKAINLIVEYESIYRKMKKDPKEKKLIDKNNNYKGIIKEIYESDSKFAFSSDVIYWSSSFVKDEIVRKHGKNSLWDKIARQLDLQTCVLEFATNKSISKGPGEKRKVHDYLMEVFKYHNLVTVADFINMYTEKGEAFFVNPDIKDQLGPNREFYIQNLYMKLCLLVLENMYRVANGLGEIESIAKGGDKKIVDAIMGFKGMLSKANGRNISYSIEDATKWSLSATMDEFVMTLMPFKDIIPSNLYNWMMYVIGKMKTKLIYFPASLPFVAKSRIQKVEAELVELEEKKLNPSEKLLKSKLKSQLAKFKKYADLYGKNEKYNFVEEFAQELDYIESMSQFLMGLMNNDSSFKHMGATKYNDRIWNYLLDNSKYIKSESIALSRPVRDFIIDCFPRVHSDDSYKIIIHILKRAMELYMNVDTFTKRLHNIKKSLPKSFIHSYFSEFLSNIMFNGNIDVNVFKYLMAVSSPVAGKNWSDDVYSAVSKCIEGVRKGVCSTTAFYALKVGMMRLMELYNHEKHLKKIKLWNDRHELPVELGGVFISTPLFLSIAGTPSHNMRIFYSNPSQRCLFRALVPDMGLYKEEGVDIEENTDKRLYTKLVTPNINMSFDIKIKALRKEFEYSKEQAIAFYEEHPYFRFVKPKTPELLYEYLQTHHYDNNFIRAYARISDFQILRKLSQFATRSIIRTPPLSGKYDELVYKYSSYKRLMYFHDYIEQTYRLAHRLFQSNQNDIVVNHIVSVRSTIFTVLNNYYKQYINTEFQFSQENKKNFFYISPVFAENIKIENKLGPILVYFYEFHVKRKKDSDPTNQFVLNGYKISRVDALDKDIHLCWSLWNEMPIMADNMKLGILYEVLKRSAKYAPYVFSKTTNSSALEFWKKQIEYNTFTNGVVRLYPKQTGSKFVLPAAPSSKLSISLEHGKILKESINLIVNLYIDLLTFRDLDERKSDAERKVSAATIQEMFTQEESSNYMRQKIKLFTSLIKNLYVRSPLNERVSLDSILTEVITKGTLIGDEDRSMFLDALIVYSNMMYAEGLKPVVGKEYFEKELPKYHIIREGRKYTSKTGKTKYDDRTYLAYVVYKSCIGKIEWNSLKGELILQVNSTYTPHLVPVVNTFYYLTNSPYSNYNGVRKTFKRVSECVIRKLTDIMYEKKPGNVGDLKYYPDTRLFSVVSKATTESTILKRVKYNPQLHPEKETFWHQENFALIVSYLSLHINERELYSLSPKPTHFSRDEIDGNFEVDGYDFIQSSTEQYIFNLFKRNIKSVHITNESLYRDLILNTLTEQECQYFINKIQDILLSYMNTGKEQIIIPSIQRVKEQAVLEDTSSKKTSSNWADQIDQEDAYRDSMSEFVSEHEKLSNIETEVQSIDFMKFLSEVDTQKMAAIFGDNSDEDENSEEDGTAVEKERSLEELEGVQLTFSRFMSIDDLRLNPRMNKKLAYMIYLRSHRLLNINLYCSKILMSKIYCSDLFKLLAIYRETNIFEIRVLIAYICLEILKRPIQDDAPSNMNSFKKREYYRSAMKESISLASINAFKTFIITRTKEAQTSSDEEVVTADNLFDK